MQPRKATSGRPRTFVWGDFPLTLVVANYQRDIVQCFDTTLLWDVQALNPGPNRKSVNKAIGSAVMLRPVSFFPKWKAPSGYFLVHFILIGTRRDVIGGGWPSRVQTVVDLGDVPVEVHPVQRYVYFVRRVTTQAQVKVAVGTREGRGHSGL